MEGAAQQPYRVREIGLLQAVRAEQAVDHLGGAAQRRGVRHRGLVQADLRGGVPPRVAEGVAPVRAGERGQRVLPRAPLDRRRDPVDHLAARQQRHPGTQVPQPAHMRVQTRVLDVETPGQRGQGDVLVAGLVGEVGGGRDEAVGGESGAGYAGLRRSGGRGSGHVNVADAGRRPLACC
ncbi:hypothetical protein GCM10010233_12750 [Streptomyces pseudogriseolus]|nr:hypothetical protein GCM10010233_12750 [Streptomyces gancidicus]